MGRFGFFALAVSGVAVATALATVSSTSTTASAVSPPGAPGQPFVHHSTVRANATARANVGCELDITADTKLTSDVACVVAINASNVTLDLNHHTVSALISGARGLTVRNGTLTAPLYAPGASDITVEHVLVTGIDTIDPSAITVGANSVIRNNHFENNGGAIDLFFGGDGAVVVHNTFVGNTLGVWNNSAANVTVTRNNFTQNVHAISLTDEDGLASEDANNHIVANTFRKNVVGIEVGAFIGVRDLVIGHNKFVSNEGPGAQVFVACSAGHCGGKGMVIASNAFTHNGFLPDVDGANSGFSGSSARLGDPTLAGMHHVTLVDNTAIGNAGLGLYAPGAVDGGGNVARRNRDGRQCAGVACTPEPPPF